MKKMKKVLALTACAAMLVTASVMGTLAFLTAEETITNTFTVGKVTFGDEDGEGMLVEYKVNEDGKPVNNAGEEIDLSKDTPVWTDTNHYKLVSGRTYTKNPTLNVGANSEPCYLYVAVANEIADIEAGTVSGGYAKIVDQMKENGWLPLAGKNYSFKNGDTVLATGDVYMYCGTGSTTNSTGLVVDHLEDNDPTPYTIFEEFKISDEVSSEDLKKYAPTGEEGAEVYKTIRIAAFAVQQADEGMDTAAKAWNLTFGKE